MRRKQARLHITLRSGMNVFTSPYAPAGTSSHHPTLRQERLHITLRSARPAQIAYIIDTPRCVGPQTFMTNMLQVEPSRGIGLGGV